jgi:hypothetical protein
LTADTTVDVTPATPRQRRHLRRAGLLSTVIVAGFLGLAVPAEATETTLPIRGTAHTGTPPVSTCTSEFVEEYKYPNEGYRVRASCTSLADWTEARGISTYPYDGHNETEWFDQTGRDHWSEWNVQWRLPVGSLHPRGHEDRVPARGRRDDPLHRFRSDDPRPGPPRRGHDAVGQGQDHDRPRLPAAAAGGRERDDLSARPPPGGG